MKENMKDSITLVTAALPYPNGPLHLGHVAGVHLPGDIFYRHVKMMGERVLAICGTDDHGVGIEIAAKKEGISEDELVSRNRETIIDSLKKIGILYDNFSRTHSEIHFDTATDFFQKIMDKGLIEAREEEMAYCGDCNNFLPDRYIEGTCPNCKSEGARGDQCEKCGKLTSPGELIDPICKMCCSTGNIITKTTTSYFFLLSKFQEQLEQWIFTKVNWKANVKGTAIKWLKEGLEDRAISRDIRWGIPIPGEDNKKMYVWFEAPIGYISFLKELAEQNGEDSLFDDIWKNDDSRIVHFIGKDNIVFHTIIWPAILMAYGDLKLPTDVPGNEFLNLEGQKLSTSRNYAVWLHDIVENFNQDSIRYYLTYCIPERKDSNFTWEEFQEKNNELANNLGNLINRVFSFSLVNYDGVVNNPTNLLSEDIVVRDNIVSQTQEVIRLLEDYRFREALSLIFLLLQSLNKYFNDSAPWKVNKTDFDRSKDIVDNVILCIINISILLKPFLPFTADKILEAFGIMDEEFYKYSNIGDLPISFPVKLTKVGILFKKIENEEIIREKEKIGKFEVGL